MKLDLNKKLVTIDGEEFESDDSYISKILGNILWSKAHEIGDCIKYSSIASKLYQGGLIEIDKNDLDKIYTFIEKVQDTDAFRMEGFVRAQILRSLSDSRAKATIEENKKN